MQKKAQLLFLLFFSLMFAGIFSYAQSYPEYTAPGEENKFTDRLLFGGGLGLQFGTLTFIDISPVVGYRLTERLETGVGFSYKYYRYKDFYFDPTTGAKDDLKSHMIGGSVYSRYHILENIFLHTEFERLRVNTEELYMAGGQIVRNPIHYNINGLFVGGGLKQRISNSSYFYLMGLWDIVQDSNSPYSNPIIRMGILLSL